jgi:hypothetical protein
MIPIKSVAVEDRDRWRHELNHIASRLTQARAALGVVGAMEPRGSLRGFAVDITHSIEQLEIIQEEIIAITAMAQEANHDG